MGVPDEVVGKLQALLQWRNEASNEEGVDATDTLISQLLQRTHPNLECVQGILTLLLPNIMSDDADQHVRWLIVVPLPPVWSYCHPPAHHEQAPR